MSLRSTRLFAILAVTFALLTSGVAAAAEDSHVQDSHVIAGPGCCAWL